MFNKDDDIDVLLIYPKTGIDFGSTIAPPHAFLTIAAPLDKKGYKVRIIDQRVDNLWRQHIEESLQKRPICVGVSSMTGTQIYYALEIAKIVREAANGSIPIVWGGAHPSSMPEQTAEDEFVDVVCVGEGDITLMELVEAFARKSPLMNVKGIVFKDGNKIVMTPQRPLLDIEGLLNVPWHLIDLEKYIHRDFYIKNIKRSLDIGQTSRGCPFDCGFCSSASLRQRKWRAMSVEKSLERIIGPIKQFNLDGIWIRDDEFYIDRNRADSICEGIIKSGIKIKWYTSGTRIDIFNRSSDEQIKLLKKSGADTLKFGAESGSDRILKLMQKGIRREDTIKANLKAKRCGITPAFALMVGFPGETLDDINQTIELFVQLKKDNPKAQFEAIGTYTALPKTPLYELAIKSGLKPPRNLEGWIYWLSDEYDIEGRKIPWFGRKDRKKIGNLTYMSILANISYNAIEGIENNLLRLALKLFILPISHFERFKLKNKWYAFAPELGIARYLRKKIFYGSHRNIR